MTCPDRIEVFIGARIEHASERALLEGLLSDFRQREGAALAFMNFHASGRQIDGLVVTDRKFLVIEAKGYNSPVRGTSNGPWEVAIAGGWRKFSNPYLQTVNAALALRDSMRSFSGDDGLPYPSGALVFVPRVPNGSAPYGDYKARVCGLAELPDQVDAAREHTWPLERWRRFADWLGLERVGKLDAAYSSEFYEAEKRGERYASAFRSTYGSSCSGLEEFLCHEGSLCRSSSEVVMQARDGESMLLRGPSGCGKSMLAARIGIDVLGFGHVPILLQAKHFLGRLKDALNHEVSLLDVSSTRDLLRVSTLLGTRCVLIVDGYNECAEHQQGLLTRSILAFARRYRAQLLVTSQTAIAKAELLPLRELSVPEPGLDLKASIAAQGAGGAPSPELDSLLAGISSGLEARLVGEVGQGIASGASRYALFDAYVRSRLRYDASEGIRILSRIAGEMVSRLSFTLTVRERDRLVSDERDPAALLRIIERSNLLVQRGERISFRHELFFHAFTAEAVVRGAKGEAPRIVAALKRPIFSASNKALIVGAIDNNSVIQRVLSETDDHALLLACRSGECGAYAQQCVEQKLAELIPVLRSEIENADFAVGCGRGAVGFDSGSLYPWSPNQRGLLEVLSRALFDGEHLDAVFAVVRDLDDKIEDAVVQLKDDHRLSGAMSIRNALFAHAYTFPGFDNPGIAVITSMVRSGRFSLDRRHPPPPTDKLLNWFRRGDLSYGQKYLLLQLCEGMSLSADTCADVLCKWLPLLKSYPNRLVMEVLHRASCLGRIGEPQRSRLAEALQAFLSNKNPLLNASIFDALERLGALEEDAQAQLPSIKDEIAEVLADQESPESWTKAYRLYSSCIDHPHSSAFCEAINELRETEHKTFLRLVSLGTTYSPFALTMLVWEVARYDDPELVAALARWTDLPIADTVVPQDAVEAFVVSNALMGRHNISLPTWDASDDSEAASAMRACGLLYYEIGRAGAEGATGIAGADRSAWSVLLDHEAGVGAYALYLCDRALRYPSEWPGTMQVPSIGECYPQQVAEVCREALKRVSVQKAYYPQFHSQDDMLRFCIGMLGRHGQASDIPFLRHICDNEELGRSAIEAIWQLER